MTYLLNAVHVHHRQLHLTAKVIAEQQQLADIFTQQGIIPKPISIKQAVWGAK